MSKNNCQKCGAELEKNSSCSSCEMPQVKITHKKNRNSNHSKSYLCGIICFSIALALSILYAINYGSFLSELPSEKTFILIFLLILLTNGFILIPAYILLIVSSICFGLCSQSTIKKYKIISKTLFIISIVLILIITASILVPFIISK